jgi:predicted enzyme related to lactoylglutathione lyase
MSEHHIVHVEFSAQDREIAGKFYSELFGWKVQQVPEMDYALYETGGDVAGGFNPVSENNPAGMVIAHVSTDDIEATLAKADSLGGKTLVTKTEIPDYGWYGLFSDPTGNVVGLYTPLSE